MENEGCITKLQFYFLRWVGEKEMTQLRTFATTTLKNWIRHSSDWRLRLMVVDYVSFCLFILLQRFLLGEWWAIHRLNKETRITDHLQFFYFLLASFTFFLNSYSLMPNVMFLCYSCSQGDYVRVYLNLDRPEVNEESPWSGLLCGTLPTTPPFLYSAGSVLTLELHSGGEANNSTGFQGTFRFIDTSEYI